MDHDDVVILHHILLLHTTTYYLFLQHVVSRYRRRGGVSIPRRCQQRTTQSQRMENMMWNTIEAK
jgi:hypothetical protein